MGRTLQVKIVGDSSSLSRALGQATGSLGGFGSAVGRTLKVAAVAGTAALAGLGGMAVKSAVDFESSFAGVRKTVDATEGQFKALERGIRSMAKQIPVGVNQLNEIAESAGQLGIQRKAILGFTRVVADMGVTTNLVGEEASSSMARLANIVRMPQTEFDRLGSTIVALGNAGASTERDIVAMGLRIAAAGDQVGMSLPQILAMANAMSSVGIEAEAGGTAMSTVIMKMASAVADGGKKLDGFAKVAGMSGGEFKRAFEQDATSAVVAFVEGLDRIKKEGGNAGGALDDLKLKGVRVKDTLLRLAGAGDLVTESVKLGSKAWRENTALGKEAAERYKTTASQLQVVRNNLIDLGISVGQTVLPAISKALRGFTSFLEQLRGAKGFRAKIDVALDLAKGAGELALRLAADVKTALAGVDWESVWSSVATKADGIATAIQTRLQTVDWTTVGRSIGTGISASITFGAEVATNVASKVMEIVRAIDWVAVGRAAGPGLAAAVATMFVTLTDPAFWARNWDLALAVGITAFGGSIGRLAGKFGALLVKPLASAFEAGILGIAGAVERVSPKIGEALLRALMALPGLVARLLSPLTSLVSRTFDRLGALATFAVKVTGVAAVVQVIAGLATAVGQKLASLASTVSAKVQAAVAAVKEKATAAYDAAKDLALRIIRGVLDGLVTLPSALLAKLAEIAGAIRATAANAASWAAGIGQAIVRGIVSGMGGLFGAIVSAGQEKIRGALSYLRGHLGSTAEEHSAKTVGVPLGKGVVLGFLLGLGDLPEKVSDRLRNALERGRQAVEGARGVFSSAFSRLGGDALRAFDAETEKMLAKIDSNLERALARIDARVAARVSAIDARLARTRSSIEEGAAAPTESEAEIARIERRREEERLVSSIADAEKALAEARAKGDAEEIAAAERRLAVAKEDLELDRLRAKAAEERRAKEAFAQAAIEKAEADAEKKKGRVTADGEREKNAATARAERLKLELGAERELERRSLEDRLAALETYLARRGASHAAAHKKLMAAFAEHGVDYESAGENLGKAFAAGMLRARTAVEKAAAEIAAIVERYLKVKSPTEKGPMSDLDGWWSRLGATLVSGLDRGSLASGISRALALPAAGGPSAGGVGVLASDRPTRLEIPVYLDGREIARVVRDRFNEDLRANPRLGTTF